MEWPIRRSFLFAPASEPRKLAKAVASHAHGVILDLEDSVAEGEKPAARGQLRGFLDGLETGGERLFVRVNATDTPWHEEDLTVACHPHITGIFLPKATEAALQAVDARLSSLEQAHGRAPLAVMAIVESARGILDAAALAAHPRVRQLAFGNMDLVVDLGLELSADKRELLYARSHLVVASRAAGRLGPIDMVYPALDNPEGLLAEAQAGRRLGFSGKLCIHPAHVEIIHRAFAPAPERLAWARRVASAFAQAEEAGRAAIRVDAAMVDYPVYREALQVLADAGENPCP